MRITGMLVARDACATIEACVRHNLQYVDHIVAFCDEAPGDETLSILKLLMEEGLPLEVHSTGTLPGKFLAEGWPHNRFRAQIWEWHKPDWIVPTDADEFIASSASGLRDHLSVVQIGRVGLPYMRWRPYAPVTSLGHKRWLLDTDHPLFTILRPCQPHSNVVKCITPGHWLGPLVVGNHRPEDPTMLMHPIGMMLGHAPVVTAEQMIIRELRRTVGQDHVNGRFSFQPNQFLRANRFRTPQESLLVWACQYLRGRQETMAGVPNEVDDTPRLVARNLPFKYRELARPNVAMAYDLQIEYLMGELARLGWQPKE